MRFKYKVNLSFPYVVGVDYDNSLHIMQKHTARGYPEDIVVFSVDDTKKMLVTLLPLLSVLDIIKPKKKQEEVI